MTIDKLAYIFRDLKKLKIAIDKIAREADGIALSVQQIRANEIAPIFQEDDREIVEMMIADLIGGGILTLRDMEDLYVRRMLEIFGGNKTKTARILKINVKTLYNRLKRAERRRLGSSDIPARRRE